MLSLTTNVNDLILQRTLLESTLGLNQAINRLTTGYKVLGAKDNAAGHSIIEDLNTKISSMLQVEQNAADGLAMLGIMEGGLDQIIEQMQQLRNLAMDSANGTYDVESREAMQVEADSILESIEQIKSTAQYDKKSLFQSVSWVDCDSVPVTTNLSLYTEPVTQTQSQTQQTEESTNNTSSSGDVQVITMGTEINGSVEIGAKCSKTVTIDGVQYKLTNRHTTDSNSISWSKDTTTGVITFSSNNFIIEGQLDVAHNIIINGQSNNVFGGNLDDIIKEANSSCNANGLSGASGNDILIGYSMNSGLYGGDGNDTLTKGSYSYAGKVYGGAGDDIININCTSWGSIVSGDGGNDTFNFSSNSTGYVILGGNGDDTFNFAGTLAQKIDGGAGTNTINGSPNSSSTICNTTYTNNGNAVTVDPNSTETLMIDGKNYEITNNSSNSSYVVLASLNSGVVTFSHNVLTSGPKRADTYFESSTTSTHVEDSLIGAANYSGDAVSIKGEASKAHNVKLTTTDIEFIGGDLDDTITLTMAGEIARGGAGNDTIYLNFDRCVAYGDEGNDTITSNYHYTALHGGAGDDILKTVNDYVGIIDTEGANTITQTSYSHTYSSDNSTTVTLAANETKEIVIGGKTYTITNYTSHENAVLYKYDETTGLVDFFAMRVLIKGSDNQEHYMNYTGAFSNIAGGNMNDTITVYYYGGNIYGMAGDDNISCNGEGNGYFYGGSGNDTFTLQKQGYFYGESGNDTFDINYASSATKVEGGAGNDIYNVDYTINQLNDSSGNNTYYVNANNSIIVGGSNTDTFYINSSGNNINGGNGDDHFVINNTGANTVNGADGINTAIDNSAGGATLLNITTDNSGILNFYSANETQDLTISGITYTIINTGADNTTSANNSIMYSYNSGTGELRLEGTGFTISSSNTSKLLIRGDNNKVNGTTGNDCITIESGVNNIVDAGAGNDTLTMDSAENSLIGGAGSDNIILNATTSKEVSGGDGNDVLVLNSSNNININLGDGDDILRGSGSSNLLELGDGKNTINLNGNSNTITTGVGNDSITINGNFNTVIDAGGNNNVSISGKSNEVTLGDGDDRISLNGNENELDTGDGKNSVTISGSTNSINCGIGNDTISIRGNENEILCNDGMDNITIKVGDSNLIDGGDGEDRLIDKGSNTNRTSVLVQKSAPFKLNLKIDTGYDDNSLLKADLDLSILNLEIDLTTKDGALQALIDIDDAIATLREKSIELGGIINRVENIIDYQNTRMNSLISTRSTFQDADVAEESSKYIRYQILQQASATLLASSRNLRAENVLGLLQGLRG